MSEKSKDLTEPVSTSPRLERKLVVILAADVVRFSSHMERDEERTLELLTHRRQLFDRHVEFHVGRITGTAGDSVVAEFASVVNAVDCAVKIQKEIIQANKTEPGHEGLSFRIGINVGDVMIKDADIFGDGVNVAARLESLAEPDGICISRGVHEYVRKQTNYVYRDMGEQQVKNLEHPLRAYSLLFEDGEPVISKDSWPADEEITAALEPSETPEYELTFWDSIRESDNPAEFEAYLEQYPEGKFVALATERLKTFAEQENQPDVPVADPVEMAFWESVKDSGNVDMFKAYLESYPEGAFANIARIQVEQLA